MFEAQGRMTREEHDQELAKSMHVKKGEFLDFHLQRQIQTEFSGEEDVLSAADGILDALRAGPDSLFQGVSDLESQRNLTRYYLCLLEIARSIVGTRINLEADYRVIRGREYCGASPKEKITLKERPYIEGITILAMWYKKYSI